MKEPAAYAMCVLGGKASPTAADVKAVIEAAGGTADEEQLTALCAAMEGKSFAEMCAAGMEKIKDVPMGGGGGAAPAEEEKKEEEEEEEVDMGGGMDMFGGEEGGGDDY